MARIERAVFDSGPLIHLSEISAQKLLSLFREILLSDFVKQELLRVQLQENSRVIELSGRSKDLAKLLSEHYAMGLGESTAIALAKQEGVRLFFTDDLQARDAAKRAGLEPHGTLAIIARCFREGLVSKQEAVALLEKLRSHSTLYISTDLIHWTRRQIEEYRK